MSDGKPWEMDWTAKPAAASAAPSAPAGKPWEHDWTQGAAPPDVAPYQPVALPGQEKSWLKGTSDPGTQKSTIHGSDEPGILGAIAQPFKEGGPIGLSDETEKTMFGEGGKRTALQALAKPGKSIIDAVTGGADIAGRAADSLNRGGVEALMSVMPNWMIKQDSKDLPTSKSQMREDLNLMAQIGEMLAGTEGAAGATAIEGGTKMPKGARPQAMEARQAGYVLPPAMAVKEPGMGAELMSGLGGKHKLWQAASYANQENTTKLAISDLGLGDGARLTPDAFKEVRQKVGASRDAIQQILPDMPIDRGFRTAIENITDAPAELQKAFPSLTKTNPKIIDLQRDLLGAEKMSANNAVELTRRLRTDAQRNFKIQNDPDSHALAVAQMRASDAIEDMIEGSIKGAPSNLAANLRGVNKEYDATLKLLEEYRAGNRVQYTGMQHINRLEAKLSELAKQKEDTLRKARSVQDAGDRGKILDGYQKARQLAAKSYDVEMATNEATGEVSAQRLAGLRKLGRPLSGKLKSIADSYDAFPQALQNTTKFGGAPEQWSVLDTTLAGQDLLSGHPGGAALAMTRPLFRKTVLSPKYQDKLLKPQVTPGGIQVNNVPPYVPVAGGVSMREEEK